MRRRLRPVRRAARHSRETARVARDSIRIAVGSLRRAPVSAQTPLVSIVIATYNWSSVLRYAIESVLRQSYSNWELLVVGDGCTDDSEFVVRSFDDPRIRWVNLVENTGNQSAPNNAGLALASGEYIAYHGHDDLWLRDHLIQLVAALERNKVGMASTVYEVIGPPRSNFRLVPFLMAGRRFAHMTTPSSIMHRRECVDEVGAWRDYREIVEAPDVEFIDRVEARYGAVIVPAFTVCKFNSALRRNSYVERRSDEQAHYSARIAHERFFVLRELLTVMSLRIRRPDVDVPVVPEAPEVVPPGWFVTEWRRIRGLEPPLEETATPVTPDS